MNTDCVLFHVRSARTIKISTSEFQLTHTCFIRYLYSYIYIDGFCRFLNVINFNRVVSASIGDVTITKILTTLPLIIDCNIRFTSTILSSWFRYRCHQSHILTTLFPRLKRKLLNVCLKLAVCSSTTPGRS